MAVPGDLLPKDPDAELFYVMDWTDWLPESALIATSEWEIDGGDGELILDNSAIVSGNLKTRVRLVGGTLGERYTVRNRIVTSESPTQTDDRSFVVAIVHR
jgi:hypothetical protein